MNISFEQIKIFKKINTYSKNKNCLTGFFFCSFAENIGFAKLKLWSSKKNIFLYSRILIKEIYSVFCYNDYEFLFSKKNKKKFNSFIVSWGVQKNIFRNKIYDPYFRVSSNKLQNNLWFFILKDINLTNLKALPNVVFVFPKKVFFIKKIVNFFTHLFYIISQNPHSVLENFTWHSKFSKQINSIIKKFINKDMKLLLMPYEGQPFQTNLIRMIRKNKFNININGFVHSYSPFPTHLVRGLNTPDKLIVTSEDQLSTFNKYLKWPKQNIKILPSARFVLQKNKNFSNKIYLPIDFVSHKKVFNTFIQLILFFEEYDLKEFKIVNHPHSFKSKKHLKLIFNIKNYLKKHKFKSKKKLTDVSIFIGSTGSIIEALKHKICAYHICEDPIFESYTNKLWPSIQVQVINENIFKYKSCNLKKLSLFGEKKSSLKKYLT